jgi:hypothetical protein
VYTVEETFDDAEGNEAAYINTMEQVQILQYPVFQSQTLP